MKKKKTEKHTCSRRASSPIRPGVGVDIDNTRVCGGGINIVHGLEMCCVSSPMHPDVGVDVDVTSACGGGVHIQSLFVKSS
jgi:hypothetical protein